MSKILTNNLTSNDDGIVILNPTVNRIKHNSSTDTIIGWDYTATRDVRYYTVPFAKPGVPLDLLNFTYTPKTASSILRLDYMLSGETHYDTGLMLHVNGTPLFTHGASSWMTNYLMEPYQHVTTTAPWDANSTGTTNTFTWIFQVTDTTPKSFILYAHFTQTSGSTIFAFNNVIGAADTYLQNTTPSHEYGTSCVLLREYGKNA